MLLFRSEEHLEAWLASGEHPRGESMTVQQQWDLARLWFTGRDRPDWRKRSAPEANDVFRAAGLTGRFWTIE
jgi:hypothetical protein